MAQETFAYNIAERVLLKLASLAFQEACLVCGVESNLERLKKTLSTIKAVLLDAEEQQFHNQQITVWLEKLIEVFYDAQDVVDEFERKALQNQVIETHWSITKKPIRIKFHLSERLEIMHVVRGREMSHSFVQASDVIGRDHDKENIIQHLMHASSDGQNLSVIPVVGIGGLGKTVLAKYVFNDARVINHFEFKCWDRTKWMELRGLLMGGANGCKIIVTTRSPRIASMMGTESPYNLEGLPHKECLSLFIKWAFDEGNESLHANLVEIGDEIVKKCKGVPLAVKSLGSLLYSKFEERYWLFVKDNEIWKLDKKEGDILSALQLSYNQMPSSLKQCFAYCSLYPKDYDYNSLELIQLWMAHGLLESPNGIEELEDIGNQYVDELYSRSFLEDYTDVGCFRLFKIHDLAHDLAISVAKKSLFGVTQGYTSLRMLVIKNCGGLISLFPSLKCLTGLEVLDIKNCKKLVLTEGEENQEEFMMSLRVLRLIELPQMVVLPHWIKQSARTLQRMAINGCPNLTVLPEWLSNLSSLRVLVFRSCPKLASLSEGQLCRASLRSFIISECPELSRRCQPEIGEEWHKIAHHKSTSESCRNHLFLVKGQNLVAPVRSGRDLIKFGREFQQQFHNQQITVWLGKLIEVFYDAQDVVDEFECEALQKQVVETHWSITKKLTKYSNSLYRLWDLGQQRCVHSYAVHTGSVWALASTPSFSHVYSGGRDLSLYLTDLATRESLLLCTGEHPVLQLAMHDDSIWVATTDSSVHRWPAEGRNPQKSFQRGGSFLAGNLSFSRARVPVFKEPTLTIPGTPGIVQHEILNNRRHVLTKDTAGSVKLWEITRGIVVTDYGKVSFEEKKEELFEMADLNIAGKPEDDKDLLEWGVVHLKGTEMRAIVCKVAWWATVYSLWSQRNAIIHAGQIKSEDQLLNIIKRDVKNRLHSKNGFRDTILNRILCCNWGISVARVNLARETLKGLLAHWLAKRKQRFGSQPSANGDLLSGKDISHRSITHSRIEVDSNAENDSMVYPPFEFSTVYPPSIITEGSHGGPWRKKITDFDGTEDEKDFPFWCLDCVLNNRLPPRENTK
uniref:Uncharacterized protein n=1 Tax=Fagus sylvatica TaxID=28930 RepID=A0A2N9EPM6_FAGSY